MWFLQVAEELSVGINSPVEDSPFLFFIISPHSRLLFYWAKIVKTGERGLSSNRRTENSFSNRTNVVYYESLKTLLFKLFCLKI